MFSQKKVLVVEDNALNRNLLCQILASDYDVLEAANGQEALDILKRYGEGVSLILLDIVMPVMDGYTFLSIMKAEPAYSSIPVIVTTQNDGESDEVAALSHGATDFVAKPYRPQIILHRVAGIINLRETAAMINLIQYDRLTGLYSKEFFYQQAQAILLRNPGRQYDIVCSDIENFKLINDVFGVPTGDRLLRGVAELFQQRANGLGICGRMNSDQFACLLERRWSYTDEIFQEAGAAVNELLDVRNIGIKWGVYSIEDRSVSVETMCDRAILAARSIKGQYGKYFAIYDDKLRDQLLREQAIADSMESALAGSQFQVYLQPKYRIKDESLIGAEALVRWNHPEWGFQSPAQFIPLFEKNGFITKLDQYVWGEAERTVRQFCHAWFVERNPARTAGFLTDDICFIGTGAKECACGKAEMESYLQLDIREIPEPFSLELTTLQQQSLAENAAALSAEFTLENSVYAWRLRGFFVLLRQEGGWRICNLHFAELSNTQRGGEHYPFTLVMENAARQRQELLNDSLPGGMMGGYIEDGFPFYFVNHRMLCYLGYENEDEFVADIDGLIANCMHPDDRQTVDMQVAAQLAETEEYVVEYRMKKKDGSYIWVHDVGRRMTAEDGRPAIASVCIDITAQRRAQEELLHLYNNIPGAVFRCRFDQEFSVIDANDGLFEFLGYTREEFAAMGNRMSAVIYPADLAVMTDQLNAQLREGNTIHNENRLICKDGTVKWISIKAQLLPENNGERHFYCVFVDITEEKQLQERVGELYEQELTYFAESSAVANGIQGRINVTQDRVENYLATTDVAVTHVGDTFTATIEHLAASAVDEDYGGEIRRALERNKVLADYAAGKVDYRFEFLRRRNGGGVFWCSTSFRACQNPETGDVIIFFYTFDITEQKLQERLLGRIAELDYDIITEIDIRKNTHRHISFIEDRKATILPPGEFQQGVQTLAARFMEGESKREYLRKLDFGYMKEQLAERDFYSFVVEMRDQHGDTRVKRIQVFYISKEFERVCMARTDVTDVVRQEQRQKEELAAALVAAEQANAAKSDFLSRMSHEIRTPMNAIIGMSAIAAQSVGDDEQVADCISKIGISSRFLLSLINDILDMSRIESGKMLLKNGEIPTEEFLNGVNSICYSQAAAKGVDYECIADPVLDDYYIGDAMKLQQVLINILNNAIKFTGEGGKVTFSAEQHRRTKNDAVLRFIVNDTGVGMGEEFLPHIFEPFSQESTGASAQFGGTGLGLAISKNIVDMMDGKIAVRSIKGIGTEFTVDVKLGLTEEGKHRHNQKKQNYNFSHLRTLVVDDDVAVCEGAVATLREMGVTAEWVDSGRKAVDRVRDFRNAGKYYDMILIDWKMPDMDGIETARRIRGIVGPDVTIIIMTAYDWISIEHEAKLAGVNLLMSKPMFKTSLISAFSRAMGEKEEQKSQEELPDYDFTGKRVLLVEDNAINTEVAVLLLESKGFAVETAENGLRALEVFSKSAAGRFDAILMDIRMPLMDGLAAASNIRHLSNADARAIPIIAMTANAFDDDIEKSKAAGMNAHLAKPIEPERMYHTLHDLIFGKEA